MNDIFNELAHGHDEAYQRIDGNVIYWPNLMQGTDEWLKARLGLMTASEMKLVLTPTLKVANNDKVRAHVYELAAQRISQYVEPTYQSDDMLRGHIEEIEARNVYSERFAKAVQCGFVTNSKWGFTIGYSPDGLVGEEGQIEVKSRRQKSQVQTICEHVALSKCTTIPTEYVLQAQTGLMVTERNWCDFISYSNGLPMAVIRVFPDPEIQTAIEDAARQFEDSVEAKRKEYLGAIEDFSARLIPTERKEYEELLT